MAIRSISFEEDLLESLTDPEEAGAYLAAALRDSKGVFLEALRDVAKAHKMAKVAEEASVERASLYRMLSANGNPNFDNISAVLDVMGLAFSIVPKERQEQSYAELPHSSLASLNVQENAISDRLLEQVVLQGYFQAVPCDSYRDEANQIGSSRTAQFRSQVGAAS